MSVLTRAASRTTKRAAIGTGRAGWKMALATTLGCVFGWWGDLPGNVKREPSLERAWETRAQVMSALFWPAFAVWLAAGAPRCPGLLVWAAGASGASALPLLAWQVVVTLFATVVVMRRIMAASGHPWRLGALVKSSRRWVAFHQWLWVPLAVCCVLLPAWWLVSATRPASVWGQAIPVVALISVGAFIVSREAAWRRKMAYRAAALAQVLKCTEDVAVRDAAWMPRKGEPDGFDLVFVPPAVKAHLDGIRERMAVQMATLEATVRKNEHGDVASVAFMPVSDAERTRREWVERTGGLITAVEVTENGAVATLGEAVKSSHADEVELHLSNAGFGVLTYFAPLRHTATATRLDDETARVRDIVTTGLKCFSHEVEVRLTHADDETTGERRIDEVLVVRNPLAQAQPEQRLATWTGIMSAMPGWTTGWRLGDAGKGGVVTMTYGPPRRLPALVSSSALLPESRDTAAWHRIPLGVTPEGTVAAINLKLGPHALIVGPTGSGKSYLLKQHILSALVRGHDVIVIDAKKGGRDFNTLRPWCRAFSERNIQSASALIEAVYAEGQKRADFLDQYPEAESWEDIPAPDRARAGLVPLTVIIDELMSSVLLEPVPKLDDKNDPRVVDAVERNAARQILLATVGSIARELRFVGIFLVVATQRPDASQLAGFGEIRSNLTSAVQLIKPGSMPARETLAMVFPGEQAAAAAETIRELDDGVSRGTALVGADGGEVEGFRVGHINLKIGDMKAPELLRVTGVPEVTPWDVALPERAPREGEIITPGFDPFAPRTVTPAVDPFATPAAAVVAEPVGEVDVEFTLDDLEALVDDEASQPDPFDPLAAPTKPTSPALASPRVVDFEDDDFGPTPALPPAFVDEDPFG